MRTMHQIINLFVDGEITTHEQAMKLIREECGEYESVPLELPGPARAALAAMIADTATRLCAPPQAERILELLKMKEENE